MRNYGLVLCLVLAFGCGSKAKKGDLTVTGTPTGAVEGKVRVILAFGRPMVAKDRVDMPVAKVPVKLAPDVPIEARWSDEKTLVVVPTASLPVSTKFVVTVAGDMKAIDGSVLGTPYTFEFYTERLTGTLDVLGSKERAKRDQTIKLVFNHDVAAAEIEKQCSFSSKAGNQKVKLGDTITGRAFSITPAAPLALDTDYTIACKAGMRGVVGNLGLDKPLEDKLHTYGALKYVAMDPAGNDIVPDEDLRLKLSFTNPLAEPFKITITPPVPGFPQGCHALADSPPGVSCSGQFEARTDYVLTIDGAQTDVFGQKLDKPQVLSFRTTDAKPTISLESGYFVAELKRPVVPVWTRNVSEVQVTAIEVTQANFHELSPLIEWWDAKPIDFKKTRLKPRDKKIAITGTKNKWGQSSIDPAAIFGGTQGPGMYYLEVGSTQVDKGVFSDGGREKVLVNFTDIGVVSKLSPTRGLVWATKLSSGKPLPGATVSVRDANGKVTFTGTTDAEGVAVLPGSDKLGATEGGGGGDDDEDGGGGEAQRGLRIYVQQGADWTMINPTASGGLSPWSFNVAVDRDTGPTKLRGFMHTDRGLYRPGDTVHVKGLARVTKLGEPLALPNVGKKVSVEVQGPQGKTVTTTNAKLSAFGGFWFDIELPGDSRLGDYTVSAKLDHGTFTRTFSVEEYRPATFEVTGKTKDSLVVRRGDVKGTISANYFYGAPVRSGEVNVVVHSRKRRVRFDQHKEFDFTDDRDYESYSYYESEDSQSMVTEDHVALDQKGNATFSFSVGPNDIYSDADLLIRAAVTAPSNEVINKTFTIPYFRAKKYYGIKAPGYFLDVKKPAKFDVVSVSPDGKLVDSTAKVKVTRRDWNCVWEDWGYRGSYACKDITNVILDKMIAVSGGKAQFEFTPASGGDYLIVVEGENDKQEAAPAAQRLYAWGDGGGSWRSDDTLAFDIAADKQEYKAGDTATLILKTDLAQATGLVTIERDGVIEKRLIDITPTTKHIKVPITAAYAPNVYVSVALVQGRTGDGSRGKPRMRMGIVNLPVRPEDNRLTVSVETDKQEYRPGAQVTATVKVTDGAGKPVAAEVSITAADEGVLSLIGYQTPDPVPSFFAPWGLGVTSATQLEYIRDIPAPNVERPASGGDAAGTIRSRFVASAVWVPGAVTNAAGIATVTFAAPDNLTAFRMMAVAADKTYKFGSADKRFTVSKPLQLHSALPRFVSLGDSLQAGVVVHNETKTAGTATVKLVSDEHVTIAGGAEKTVQVTAGGRVPVLFDLKPAAVGTAALTFSVTMGSETDAVKLTLPVQHPSRVRTTELAYGATNNDKAIPIALPADAIPSTAELIVSVDPDGLAGIEDGLRDLIGYPYGCLEQTTSKMIPMIAVRDLAESLNLDGLTGERLDGFVKAGITKINRHQTAYGGFSLWPGGEPEAYYTAYALYGLHIAKKAGYTVDDTRIEEALNYLANDGASPDHDTPYYSEAGNLGAQAFAVYVRALYKDKAAGAAATTLLKEAKLPIYGKAYVARALALSVGAKDPAVAQLVTDLATLATNATKTEALIKEPEDDEMDWYMSTSLRTSSAVLAALVELAPKHAAIKPLVRTIMKSRRTVEWWDTQSNLYSLLALSSYAKANAGSPPSVTVAFGDKNLVIGALAGKQKLRVVTTPLTANGELSIKPRGEVNYSVTLRYRMKPDALKPESKGIELAREYFDEAGKPKSTFTVGDVVVVKLRVKAPDESAHLMVGDALPGGFEALNTRLATVGGAGIAQSKVWWGNYREMHDERVDFASEYLYEGSFEYVYSIRAIAVGKFARPPAVAELMYEPSTRAQTGFDYIEVKPK
jgi:alpha-2-macroglobulin